MRLRLPKSRLARGAIYLLSVALVLIASDLVWVESRRTVRPGYDTTRIVGPLQPDGSIDYATAIETYFSRGITPQNNAAPLVLQAFGRGALPPNQPPNGITDRLGMPPLPETGDYYVLYEDFARDHPSEDDPDVTDPGGPIPWPITFKPRTIEWVKANEKPLVVLAEASKRSRFFMPINGGTPHDTLVSVQLRYIRYFKDARRLLLTRALLRLQSDDVAGFRDDVRTSHRLARLLGQDLPLVTIMVAIPLENATCMVERTAATSGKLSAEQARDTARELSAMGDLPPVDDAVDVSERFMVMDVMMSLAKASPSDRTRLFNGIFGWAEPGIFYRFMPIPYESAMRELNATYDGMLAAMRQPTHAGRASALKLWEKQFDDVPRGSRLFHLMSPRWASTYLVPALQTIVGKAERARAEARLTRIALALAAFRAERGTYPATLAELAPAYLDAIPDDPFADKPFAYARRGDDSYALSSTGPDSVKPSDDIVADRP